MLFFVIAQNLVEIYCFFRAWVSFFAYALKYNLSLVVVSKLGNIDGAYDSKAKLLLPNLKRHSKAPYSKGITKKDTHALP
jgi:hypothetical protein